jgi:hypothetical protein
MNALTHPTYGTSLPQIVLLASELRTDPRVRVLAE